MAPAAASITFLFAPAAPTQAPNATSTSVTHTSTVAAISSEQLVLTSDISLLLLLVFIALCTLPRVVSRFRALGKQGWILQHRRPTVNDMVHSLDRKIEADRSSLDPFVDPDTQSQAGFLRTAAPRLLPHFPSYATLFHPVSSIFTFASPSLFTNFTIGQILIYVCYATYVLVNMFLYSSPVTDPDRAGWVAVSQIPVTFMLGTKVNLIGLLIGKGYEKLNYLHRWVGQLIFIAMLFHVVAYLVKWTKAGTLSTSIVKSGNVWGLVSLTSVSILAVASLPSIRNRFYTLFYYSHIIGFAALIIAVAFHAPSSIGYILFSLALYLTDLSLRIYKSHLSTATLHYIPTLRTTQISIPSLNSGWRAGQHVRIRILTPSKQFWSWGEVHPFTIASASDEEGVELYCKESGDWTKKLATFAKGMPGEVEISLESGKAQIRGTGSGRVVNVLIEGPYGGPCHAVISSFSAAVVACGGSGITFGLGVLSEIVRDAELGVGRIRIVEMIWVIQDAAHLIPLLPNLSTLLSRASQVPSLSLQISVYHTRAQRPQSFDFTPAPSARGGTGLLSRNVSNSSQRSITLPPSLTLTPARPSISSHLSTVLTKTQALKAGTGTHGVMIAVCGPDGLIDEAKKCEREVSGEVRKMVGGVEVLDEGFGW